MTSEFNAYEEQVISMVLTDPGLLAEVDVSAQHFGTGANKRIFETILEVSRAGLQPDIISVADRLYANVPGVDWIPDLGGMVDRNVSNPQNLKAYCRIVKEGYYRRKHQRAAHEFYAKIKQGEEGALGDLLRELADTEVQHHATAKQSLADVFDKLDKAQTGDMPGVRTGIKKLDSLVGGFQDSHLVVLAARTGLGKTAVACNFALNAGVPVGIISAEQSHRELTQRMLSMKSGVPSEALQTGKISELQMQQLANSTSQIDNIFFYDKGKPTIDEVTQAAMQMKYRHGIKILFVDYLQIIDSDKGEMQYQRIGDVSGKLKALAKQLDIPVIALAQVSRGVELRDNKRPRLSDLRESGSIEQDADLIMFVYRHAVYEKDADENEMELILAKNRHGRVGVVKVQWIPELMKIGDRIENRNQ